ncbi:Bug family tripartite tricarboxylate transporter substrate binding protein [Azohydromonas lata]|uniref:Tripartite tricarboxylate transporter substrate binding protein n=1 Tax=Azohydromonas lata TaxID=45677 RepID=A0ABU5IQP5_9BURK|nr:tripartite tricarboxylate transporter substrate binding protein [Azohydromonas lata]MDZ5461206.1 tripartite tricarboxylate transporter substrate binding protein [Azohydromonas lata]
MNITLKALCAATTLSLLQFGAVAQAWPDKPVRLVVPYAPGGTTDFAARMVAEKLTQQTGKTFFVENKAGASGTIASSQVAKSAPDGTNFLVNDTTYAMLPALFAKLPWDHANDLVPVTTLATTPVVLVVAASSPFKTAQALIDHARKNPGKLNFGSGGNGSSTHLAAEVFKREGKLSITHIPYKGAGDAMMGVIGSQVDLLITAAPTAVPQVQGGKVRALAVTGDQRLPTLPDVPTFKEAGLPGYTVTNWFGLAAPKGTPKEIVDKLQAEVAKALTDPKLKERFASMGAKPGGIAQPEFAQLVRNETKTWTEVSRSAGVKPD